MNCPTIQIGYEKLPPLWPVGYPALMLPWLKILPDADSILAPFRTNQTIGLLLLLATFGILHLSRDAVDWRVCGPFASDPARFLHFLPLIIERYQRFGTLIVLAFMFAYLGLKEERRWKIYLSAIFLGLSLNIRVQSILLRTAVVGHGFIPE